MNNFKFRNLEFKCSAFFIDLIRYLFMIEKSAMAVDMLFRKRKTVFHLRLTHKIFLLEGNQIYIVFHIVLNYLRNVYQF